MFRVVGLRSFLFIGVGDWDLVFDIRVGEGYWFCN